MEVDRVSRNWKEDAKTVINGGGVLRVHRTRGEGGMKELRVERVTKGGLPYFFAKVLARIGVTGYGEVGGRRALIALGKTSSNPQEVERVNAIAALLRHTKIPSGWPDLYKDNWIHEIMKPENAEFRNAVQYLLAKEKMLGVDSLNVTEEALFRRVRGAGAGTSLLNLSGADDTLDTSAISCPNLSPEDFRMLAELCGKSLEKITIDGCKDISGKDIIAFANLDSVKKLRILNTEITGDELLALEKKGQQVIIKEGAKIKPEHLTLLKEKGIQVVVIPSTKSWPDLTDKNKWIDEILEPDQKTTAFRRAVQDVLEKQLRGEKLEVEEHALLGYVTRMPRRTEGLDLSEYPDLSPEDLRMLVGLCGSALGRVGFYGKDYGEKQVTKDLLEKINISGCTKIRDADLSALPNREEITELEMQDNPNITGKFGSDFPNLKFLDVRGCPEIDQASLNKLRQRNVKIAGEEDDVQSL